ncbi:LLM class flavin-dependent oxidoreductase, partial [Pseudomonas aeruginosa]
YLEVFTRALESREPFDYHGEFYRLEDAGSGFLPIQRPRPPLSVGGSSAQAQRLAVRFADVYAGHFASPPQTAELKRRLNEEAAEQGRRLKFWKHFQVILGDSPAAALDIAEHYRQAAFELLLARPLDELAASPQVARDGERDRLARLEPEALREWVANTVQRSFAGVLVGSVGEVAEQILAFHRAGIEIVQLEATTENAEDIRLRRQLIERLRRDA